MMKNEDRSENNPQQGGQPTPEYRDRRSDNRTRPRNTRKMMPEDHFLFRGHKIDIILQLPAGDDGVRVQSEDAPSEPPPIRMVRDNETEKRTQGDQQCTHGLYDIRLAEAG